MTTRPNVLRQVRHAERRGWIRHFREAGRLRGVSPALLMAIASRESRIGRALGPTCKGDVGNAWGIMQIDRRFHSEWTSRHDPCNHRANILKGAEVLRAELDHFGELVPGLASYNASRGSIETALEKNVSVDTYTTGGDYTADVLQRFEWIKEARPKLAEPSQPSSLRAAAPVALASLALGGGNAYARSNSNSNP